MKFPNKEIKIGNKKVYIFYCNPRGMTKPFMAIKLFNYFYYKYY